MSVLRAEADQRPTTTSGGGGAGGGGGGGDMPVPRPDGAGAAGRDTSRAHLAGAKAFSLGALTAGPPAGDHHDGDLGADTASGVRR